MHSLYHPSERTLNMMGLFTEEAYLTSECLSSSRCRGLASEGTFSEASGRGRERPSTLRAVQAAFLLIHEFSMVLREGTVVGVAPAGSCRHWALGLTQESTRTLARCVARSSRAVRRLSPQLEDCGTAALPFPTRALATPRPAACRQALVRLCREEAGRNKNGTARSPNAQGCRGAQGRRQ